MDFIYFSIYYFNASDITMRYQNNFSLSNFTVDRCEAKVHFWRAMDHMLICVL